MDVAAQARESSRRSLERRALEERRKSYRIRARLLTLPVAAVGVFLSASQLFKLEELPSPGLLLLGFVLMIPFLATFGME